ncbi:hypothetical protein M434DRAFT_294786 [Hypoxylon sp. CO27-5]|nr:hypothetical protein M434DRAFT_294786 [Hypoxylon sp. CO27-5]
MKKSFWIACQVSFYLVSPPIIVTQAPPPPATVTVTAQTTIASVCSVPPNQGVNVPPFDARSNLTWGCLPGTICSPPKPIGCSIWAAPPDETYVCESQSYCISAPNYVAVRWPNFETYVTTISTGNWGSQASITAYPQYVEYCSSGGSTEITSSETGPASEVTGTVGGSTGAGAPPATSTGIVSLTTTSSATSLSSAASSNISSSISPTIPSTVPSSTTAAPSAVTAGANAILSGGVSSNSIIALISLLLFI